MPKLIVVLSLQPILPVCGEENMSHLVSTNWQSSFWK